MKILITVTTDIAFDQRLLRIACSFANHGYEVMVFGRRKDQDHKLNVRFSYKLIKCWFTKSALFYAEYNLRLFFLMLRTKSDIICSCDLDTLLAGTMVSVIKRNKLVFDSHEYFEESVEIVNKKGIQKTWEWIARLCLPKTNLRYTVSESLAGELSRKYNCEFKVIRNVPVGRTFTDQPRKKIIWYQGAINEGRGLECMIECMMHLTEFSFHLAGDGDLIISLKEKVRALKLENRIVFLGRMKYDEMFLQASTAYIGIDLLESASKSYYYSLSNKTFDYMHAGLPCIQMNFPEYQKIHSQFKTGVLIDQVDQQSILSAIRQLENPEFHKQCIEVCKAASKIYNWEEEEKLLLGMYELADDD
jgi:glycosyltransferase involved in cell wall biosynthesis